MINIFIYIFLYGIPYFSSLGSYCQDMPGLWVVGDLTQIFVGSAPEPPPRTFFT